MLCPVYRHDFQRELRRNPLGFDGFDGFETFVVEEEEEMQINTEVGWN